MFTIERETCNGFTTGRQVHQQTVAWRVMDGSQEVACCKRKKDAVKWVEWSKAVTNTEEGEPAFLKWLQETDSAHFMSYKG